MRKATICLAIFLLNITEELIFIIFLILVLIVELKIFLVMS